MAQKVFLKPSPQNIIFDCYWVRKNYVPKSFEDIRSLFFGLAFDYAGGPFDYSLELKPLALWALDCVVVCTTMWAHWHPSLWLPMCVGVLLVLVRWRLVFAWLHWANSIILLGGFMLGCFDLNCDVCLCVGYRSHLLCMLGSCKLSLDCD